MGIIRTTYLYCGTELDRNEWEDKINDAIGQVIGEGAMELQNGIWLEFWSDRFLMDDFSDKLIPASFIQSVDGSEGEREQLKHSDLALTAAYRRAHWVASMRRVIKYKEDLAPGLAKVLLDLVQAASKQEWKFYLEATLS